jgi:hypothetical protein
MAKKAVGLLVIALILGLVLLQVSQVVAVYNPFPANPGSETPTLTIKSPKNFDTYNICGAPLTFRVTQPHSWIFAYDNAHVGEVANITVFLDRELIECFSYNPTDESADYSLMLNASALGRHEVKVTVLSYAYYTAPMYPSENILAPISYNGEPLYQYPQSLSLTLYFMVEPPKIEILFPKTTTYDENSVLLMYSINQTTSQTYYSLDGQTNIMGPADSTLNYLTNNGLDAYVFSTVLTDLSNGSHSVTVYAEDTLGNQGNQTADFMVEALQPDAPSAPLFKLNVAFVIIPFAMVCVIAGLLLFRRHQKITALEAA